MRSNFSHYTKLGGVGTRSLGYIGSQREFSNDLKINKGNGWVLHLG